MADTRPPGGELLPDEIYPLVDYPSAVRSGSLAAPSATPAGGEPALAPVPEPEAGETRTPGPGEDGYVTVDPHDENLADHYLNAEDLVAAGILGPEHDPAPPPPRRRHRLRSSLLAALLVIVLLVVIGGIYVHGQIDPGGKPGAKVTVVIPKDSGRSKIGSILAKAGVIHDGGLFSYYTKLTGSSTLYPGTYQLAKNQSYSSVVSTLQVGPPTQVEKLTIPEGFTLQDIADKVAALPKFHLSAAKFMAASSTGQVRSPYEPAGVNNLEGLVFPATYNISSADNEVQIMEMMVTAFNDEAQQIGLAADAGKLHQTPYDVIKVASIVEREAKLDGDRGPVASSIYNRLTAGMTLGADSTLVYALRVQNPNINIATINYNQPNPYNTRLNKGLPPTPIANPGIPSLQAAAQPPATNDLYFVEINPSGKLGFASTNAGFQQLEQQCATQNLC